MQSWISSQAQGLWIALQSSGILQVCSRVLGCLGWLPGSCRSCCTSQSFSSPSPSSHHCRLCCVPCLVCKVSHLLFPHVPCRFERVFRLRHPEQTEQTDGGSGPDRSRSGAKLRWSHGPDGLRPIRPMAPAAVLRSHREGGTRRASRGAGAAEEALLVACFRANRSQNLGGSLGSTTQRSGSPQGNGGPQGGGGPQGRG